MTYNAKSLPPTAKKLPQCLGVTEEKVATHPLHERQLTAPPSKTRATSYPSFVKLSPLYPSSLGCPVTSQKSPPSPLVAGQPL